MVRQQDASQSFGTQCGAAIERGRVQTVTKDDTGKITGYEVVSIDRKGIISPPILPIDSKTYTVGDTVYFFLFRDGTGKIICDMQQMSF